MTRKHEPFESIEEIKDYASRFGMKTRGQFKRLVWLLTADADPSDIAGIWKAYSDGQYFEASIRLARTVLPGHTFSITEGEQALVFGGSIPRNACEVRNVDDKVVCRATVWDGSNEQAVIRAIVNTVFMTEDEARMWEPYEEPDDAELDDAMTVAEVSLIHRRD